MYFFDNHEKAPIIPEKSVVSFDVGIKNLSYCITQKNVNEEGKEVFDISYWEIVQLELKEKPSVTDIGTTLYQALDKRPHLLTPQHIVIENQPVLKNPRMKTIQIMILSYFLLHQKTHITLLNSSIKLKVYKGPPVEIPNIKSEYTRRKKKVIEYARYLMKDSDPEYRIFLHGCKKKDDLADSFLQAAYILNKCV